MWSGVEEGHWLSDKGNTIRMFVWIRFEEALSIIAGSFMIIQSVLITYVSTYVASLGVETYTPAWYQAVQPFQIWLLIMNLIGLTLSILFGYGAYKVGDYYDVSSLMLMGLVWIFGSFFMLTLAPLTLPALSLLTLAGEVMHGALAFLQLIYAFLSLVGYILFTMGVLELKNNTHLDIFTAAGVLMIIGILFGFTVPLAFIVFGAGLGVAMSRERL